MSRFWGRFAVLLGGIGVFLQTAACKALCTHCSCGSKCCAATPATPVSDFADTSDGCCGSECERSEDVSTEGDRCPCECWFCIPKVDAVTPKSAAKQDYSTAWIAVPPVDRSLPAVAEVGLPRRELPSHPPNVRRHLLLTVFLE
jgi:hypothetical protein